MNEVALKELPENWEWTKLSDVVTKIIGGGTPSKNKPQYWDGDIPWLTVKDMRSRRPADAMDHISENAVKESSTNIIPEDTVIIATRIGLGKVIRVPYKAAINQDLKALVVKPEIDKGYLEYWFVSKTHYLESIGSGTTVKGIRLEQVRDLDFPLAPPEQQKRIVAKIEELFSHIDAGIEALKKANKLLKQYRQSVLKAAVTGELTKEWREANKAKLEPASQLLERLKTERKDEFERKLFEWELEVDNWKKSGENGKKPGKPKKITLELDISKNVSQDNFCIPNEWVKINLDFAVSKLGDGLHGTPKYSDGEYYFINGNNLGDGKIIIKPETKTVSKTEAEIHHRDLNNKTLLVSINGTLGNIAFYDGENVILGKSACYFNILPSLSKYYIRWILESNEFKLYAEKTATGSTIKNVPLKAMREFIIPLCSESEQNKIVRLVEQKMSSIDHLDTEINQQLVKAERNKQSVLASAFSGEL